MNQECPDDNNNSADRFEHSIAPIPDWFSAISTTGAKIQLKGRRQILPMENEAFPVTIRCNVTKGETHSSYQLQCIHASHQMQ